MNTNSDNSSESDDPSQPIEHFPEPFLEFINVVNPFLQRYATYKEFPLTSVNSTKLAKAGLSATGRGDQVNCSSCDFTKSEWKEEDDPLEVHANSNPECAFVYLHSRTEDDNSSSTESVSSETELKQTFSNMADAVEDSQELHLSVPDNTKVNPPKNEAPKLPSVNKGSTDNKRNATPTRRNETNLVDIAKCNICWDADSCILFLPCRHLICCSECAEQQEKCMKCRAAVRQKVPVKRA